MAAAAGHHQVHLPVSRLLACVDFLRPFLYAVPLGGGFHTVDVLGFRLSPGPLKGQILVGQSRKDPLVHIGIQSLTAYPDPKIPVNLRVVFNFMQGGGGAKILIHDQLLQFLRIIPVISDFQARPFRFHVGPVSLV